MLFDNLLNCLKERFNLIRKNKCDLKYSNIFIDDTPYNKVENDILNIIEQYKKFMNISIFPNIKPCYKKQMIC